MRKSVLEAKNTDRASPLPHKPFSLELNYFTFSSLSQLQALTPPRDVAVKNK